MPCSCAQIQVATTFPRQPRIESTFCALSATSGRARKRIHACLRASLRAAQQPPRWLIDIAKCHVFKSCDYSGECSSCSFKPCQPSNQPRGRLRGASRTQAIFHARDRSAGFAFHKRGRKSRQQSWTSNIVPCRESITRNHVRSSGYSTEFACDSKTAFGNKVRSAPEAVRRSCIHQNVDNIDA